MIITPLRQGLVPQVQHLMTLGDPYVRVRTESDYWLYARLFSSSCPVAMLGEHVVGAVIAFRSQDEPSDVYVQDVIAHPDYRQQGVASRLLQTVRDQATTWGCKRIYLTSEPENTAAHAAWTSLGFVNLTGDFTVNDVDVTRDFKGPGKDRAVYQLHTP
jgi:GNAT superfamily N-acetyltransferase